MAIFLAWALLAAPAAPQQPFHRSPAPRPNAIPRNEMEAESVTQIKEGPWYRLRGHARLETSEFLLRADEIDYNEDTDDAEARGNVYLKHFAEGEELWADRIEYNISEQTGKFYNVHGSAPMPIGARPGVLASSNPFYFQGRWAERLEDRYILYDGFITNCKMPRPWWVLRGPKFDVIPGDARASAGVLPADMPLLTYRLPIRLTGNHTVAAVALALIRQRADAARGVAGIAVDQRAGRHGVVRVVERAQFIVEQVLRPGVIFRQRKPFFLRVMHKLALRDGFAQVVMRPEVIAAEPLEELAQRARPRRQLGRALAVGEQQRAILIADMHRPGIGDRVQPGALLDVEAQVRQFGLHGLDGGFQRGVLAGDEAFGLHACFRVRGR